MKVTVLPRQTLSDIAIQVYGDIRGVSTLAEANGISITDDLTPGVMLECPEVVYDTYFQDYVSKRNICPATEIEADGEIRGKIFTEEFTKEFA